MRKTEITKKYILFIVSLFFSALGVAFTKQAELGVSPVSSVANVMNCRFDSISLGTWLIIWNCILILGQIIILRKKFQPIQLLQIPLSFLFGWFIDIGMWRVSFIPVGTYLSQLLLVGIGIIVLGFGIALSIIANVIMNSGEAFVKAVADTMKKNFGSVKIAFDICCVTIAIVLSLVFFDFSIVGTREGTVLSALLTGFAVKLFMDNFKDPLDTFLSGKPVASDVQLEHHHYGENYVITISREYGSGGRDIGKLLAESLGIKFYDLDVIRKVAKESGLSEKVIEENEQAVKNTATHSMYYWYVQAMTEEELPVVERIFHTQTKIIKDLAREGSCVIVGRLANFILRDECECLNVFIGADMDTKIQRVMGYDNLNAKQAEARIEKVEKERSNHCLYFTHRQWKDLSNYDLYIKSNVLGIEGTVDMIAQIANEKHLVKS